MMKATNVVMSVKIRVLMGLFLGVVSTNTIASDLDPKVLESRMNYYSESGEEVIKPKVSSIVKPPISTTWQDPDTGLMWNKCPMGAKWNPERYEKTGCDLEFRKERTWGEAILYIKDASLYGYNDWRMPTLQEFNTLYLGLVSNCAENKKSINLADKNAPFVYGCGKLKVQTDSLIGFYESYSPYWTSSVSSSSENGVALTMSYENIIGGPADRPKSNQLGTFMVRGGVSNGSFERSVEIAKSDLAKEQEKEKELADASRKRQELENQKNEKLRQAYNEGVVQFQKKIKIGDYTNKGLVIGIKGQLIRVQQYGSQCVYYSPNVNPHSHRPDCLKAEKVVTGEAWVNRNELAPVK